MGEVKQFPSEQERRDRAQFDGLSPSMRERVSRFGIRLRSVRQASLLELAAQAKVENWSPERTRAALDALAFAVEDEDGNPALIGATDKPEA